MRIGINRVSMVGGVLSLLAFGGTVATRGPSPIAEARASSPTAQATAAVAVVPPGPTSDTYAWPTQSSPEPTEDEWKGATELERAVANTYREWGPPETIACTQHVVREWMRVTCTPIGTRDRFVGVLWGMAGDLSSVKGSFVQVSTLDRFKSPPTSIIEDLTRKMGVSATVTFQAKPASAMVLSLDEIGWDENYEGSSVFSRAGILLDVSWAQGEKAPTIAFR